MNAEDIDSGFVVKNGVSLLTNIAHRRELLVLQDWLEFLEVEPDRLLLILGTSENLAEDVKAFGASHNIPVEVIAVTSDQDMRDHEFDYVRAMFEAAADDICVLIKLDTIPYRDGHDHWQSHALQQMDKSNCIYVTGCTLPFRTDIKVDETPYFLSQNASNNFLIMHAPKWRAVQDEWEPQLRAEFGRFVVEATITKYCEANNVYGLRIPNTTSFRVFHTQEWGDRMDKIRANFKAGRGIQRFVTGYEEDNFGEFYMFRKHSFVKQLRISFGRWRRDLIARLSPKAGQ